jgi:hypothetical protein
LNIDGTVAAYRFPFLLAGDSVVFKTESPYSEHFYRDLKPWTHYVPVQGDLKDLVTKIKWAIGHDQEVRKIAETGREYARRNLMPLHVLCYHGLVLEVRFRFRYEAGHLTVKLSSSGRDGRSDGEGEPKPTGILQMHAKEAEL